MSFHIGASLAQDASGAPHLPCRQPGAVSAMSIAPAPAARLGPDAVQVVRGARDDKKSAQPATFATLDAAGLGAIARLALIARSGTPGAVAVAPAPTRKEFAQEATDRQLKNWVARWAADPERFARMDGATLAKALCLVDLQLKVLCPLLPAWALAQLAGGPIDCAVPSRVPEGGDVRAHLVQALKMSVVGDVWGSRSAAAAPRPVAPQPAGDGCLQAPVPMLRPAVPLAASVQRAEFASPVLESKGSRAAVDRVEKWNRLTSPEALVPLYGATFKEAMDRRQERLSRLAFRLTDAERLRIARSATQVAGYVRMEVPAFARALGLCAVQLKLLYPLLPMEALRSMAGEDNGVSPSWISGERRAVYGALLRIVKTMQLKEVLCRKGRPEGAPAAAGKTDLIAGPPVREPVPKKPRTEVLPADAVGPAAAVVERRSDAEGVGDEFDPRQWAPSDWIDATFPDADSSPW